MYRRKEGGSAADNEVFSRTTSTNAIPVLNKPSKARKVGGSLEESRRRRRRRRCISLSVNSNRFRKEQRDCMEYVNSSGGKNFWIRDRVEEKSSRSKECSNLAEIN